MNMKKIILFFLALIFPLQVLACPTTGDEYGRPFFDIYNKDYTLRTMFYSQELNHFYRRERNLVTDEISYRDSFTFPIVIEDDFENITYLSMTDNEIMSGTPISVFMHGIRYDMTVRLDTTFMALRRMALNEQIKNLYYEVLVKRLSWSDNNENRNGELLHAQNRIDELGLTQAHSSILKIEIGTIAEDMFFTENDENARTAMDELFDTIELRIQFSAGENVVAVNLESENLYKIPIYTDRFSSTFKIIEAGTYVLVENNFDADYIDYAAWSSDVLNRFFSVYESPTQLSTIEQERELENPTPSPVPSPRAVESNTNDNFVGVIFVSLGVGFFVAMVVLIPALTKNPKKPKRRR